MSLVAQPDHNMGSVEYFGDSLGDRDTYFMQKSTQV